MRRRVRSSHFLFVLKTHVHTHSFSFSCLYGSFTKGLVDITHLSTHFSRQWVMKGPKHSILSFCGAFTARPFPSSWLGRMAAAGFVTAVKFWWVWQHENTWIKRAARMFPCETRAHCGLLTHVSEWKRITKQKTFLKWWQQQEEEFHPLLLPPKKSQLSCWCLSW